MKNLLILLLVAGVGYEGFKLYKKQSMERIQDGDYIAVFGRDTCGLTKRFITELENAGYDYEYFSVDDRDTADLLHGRMELSGISTRRYNLPVVEVNKEIMIRPTLDEVASEYH